MSLPKCGWIMGLGVLFVIVTSVSIFISDVTMLQLYEFRNVSFKTMEIL
jgi:hypothetical protein